MSYSDKDHSEIFPVRNGEPQGTATERVMLDTVSDTTNFRTRVQDNGDRSQTTLRTKGGMPQFDTKSKKKTSSIFGYRTFVFADRDAPATGNRVANRNTATNRLLIKTKELVAAALVSYGVMKSTTATANPGINNSNWQDVIRLDDTGVKLNSEDYQVSTLARISESAAPGHPVLINRTHVNPVLLPLFVGSNTEYTTSGAVKTYKQGVATYKTDGSLFSFTQASGPVALNEVNGTGVRITQTVDSNGLIAASYHFNWQGVNPGGVAGATTTCYRRIDVSRTATPTVGGTHDTETKLANIDFATVNYSISSPTNAEEVSGFFYTWRRKTFAGPNFPLNVFGWCGYCYTNTLEGIKNVYSDFVTSGWSKSISYSDTYSVGYDVFALDVSRSVTGAEIETTKSGGGLTSSEKYYVHAIGNDLIWTRNTNALALARLSSISKDIYRAEYSCNSSIHAGQLRIPTVTWNFDAFDSTTKYGTGAVWVYIPSNPTYSAASEANIRASLAADNAAAAAAAATSNVPPTYDTPIVQTVNYGADAPASTRSDGDVFSLNTRDYIYFDYDENVYLSLVMDVTSSRTNSETPLVTSETDTVTWDTFSCAISIYFELSLRGVVTTFPVYDNPTGWHPDISFSPITKTGGAGWDDTFSRAHVPGNPSLSFQPLYMHQGRCPWISYTTLAEEAAGATPEFYMDVKLYPAIGRTYTGDSMLTPLVFPAPQMVAGFANYMGKYSPTNFFTDVAFPTPFRITKATGIGSPWTNQLESPFSTTTHVALSRI